MPAAKKPTTRSRATKKTPNDWNFYECGGRVFAASGSKIRECHLMQVKQSGRGYKAVWGIPGGPSIEVPFKNLEP